MLQLKYDIVHGICEEWKKYALLLGTYIALIVSFILKYNMTGLAESYNCGDIVLWLFRGMVKYDAMTTHSLDVPTTYILPNILIAFIIGNYPFKDLYGFGTNVIIRTKNKAMWWISKCIWGVVSVILVYTFLIVATLGICAVTGDVSLTPNIEICSRVSNYNRNILKEATGFDEIALYMLAISMLTSIAMVMIQIMLSQLISPVIGYIVVIAILMAGVFFDLPVVISNYFMAIRNSLYVSGGYDLMLPVIIDGICILFSIIIGLISFIKMDIIKTKERL